MNGRRLLVVSYGFPPSPLVSGVRWSLMDKYLQRLGYDVTVITSDSLGGLSDDGERVIRPRNLESSRALRRVLGRPSPTTPQGRPNASRNAPSALTKTLVPDPWMISWMPFALRTARRIARERAIDCVITTSPPESTHLVGLGVRRMGPAWVADFRDGWSFQTERPLFPTRVQKRFDLALERRVVERADVTVGVTQGIVNDFERRLGIEAIHVRNGVDPEAQLPPSGGRGRLSDDRQHDTRIRLVYTGRLGIGTTRRSAKGFFAALERLSRSEPDLAARLELVIAGPESTRDAEFLASLYGSGLVRHIGHLPRSEALRLQQSADVLLLLGSDGSEAPAKLFEYLGARRPVLYAGGPSDAARIIAETGSGVTVAHDDDDAILVQLRAIAGGSFEPDFAPGNLERFSYPHVAEQMAAAIEEAIRRKGARRSHSGVTRVVG